jgi:hypothetical protein
MTIDLLELRQSIQEHASDTAYRAMEHVHGITTMDIVIGLTATIAVLGVYEWHRRWVKGKGLRMALKREHHRVREWLSEGLTELILQGEVDGKISYQEGNRLYNELSQKLDLPDLIPRERRAKIIKEEIKRRIKSTEPELKRARQPVKIPGDKPKVQAKKKFRQATGSLLKKFIKAA